MRKIIASAVFSVLFMVALSSIVSAQQVKVYYWMTDDNNLTLVNKAGDIVKFHEPPGLVLYKFSKIGTFKVSQGETQLKDNKGMNLLWNIVAGKTYLITGDTSNLQLTDISAQFSGDPKKTFEVWSNAKIHIGPEGKKGFDPIANKPTFITVGSYPIYVNGVPFHDDFNELQLFPFVAGTQLVMDSAGNRVPMNIATLCWLLKQPPED